MNEERDAADVGRAIAGDIEAFAEIVRRWQGPLVTLAYRFCRDRDRAEDMAQAAFLKVFRSLAQWRGKSAFSSWLFAVAVSVYRSEMRRNRLIMLPLDTVRDATRSSTNAADQGDAERDAVVRRTVSTLPDKYRDTLVLFYFHGMDVRKAAQSLGLAEGTVKARLHRGRALLRKVLGPLLEDDDAAEDRR